MGILKTYFRLIKRDYYVRIPLGMLLLNWIVQRIFRINSSVPFSVHYTNNINGYKNIKMPSGVHINFAVSGGANIYIFEGTTLEIGEKTIWAYNVCIQTANHDFFDRQIFIKKSIKIGRNCWIGNSATILPGVQLGDNVTVGANSVVTKSFPSNCVIAGTPAKIIKYLDTDTSELKNI